MRREWVIITALMSTVGHRRELGHHATTERGRRGEGEKEGGGRKRRERERGGEGRKTRGREMQRGRERASLYCPDKEMTNVNIA